MGFCSNQLLCLCTLLSLLVCSLTSRAEAEFENEVSSRLVINTSSIVATISDHFLCVTVDFTEARECDYGWCKGTATGVLYLDLENERLGNTLAGLAPVMVRLGGVLQDLVVYDVGDLLPSERCTPFVYNETALLYFDGGCLGMERWDALNQFFMKRGVSVAFGLNALYGRPKSEEVKHITTPWNPSNTENFIRYTRDRAYPVIAWELGNELFGDISQGTTVPAALYAADVIMLRDIVDKLYQDEASKPSVVAPDMTQFGPEAPFSESEFAIFMDTLGDGVVDAVTRHIYNLGKGLYGTDDMINNKIRDPKVAAAEEDVYKIFQSVLKEYPKTSAWVGEGGGSARGGLEGVTDVFISAFWYLDQLGTAAKYNNQAFCRQSFVGGNYALLDVDFNPNPDYYGALLWRQLMGNGVFKVEIEGGTNEVRAYAHCQRNNQGGLTLLILNYSNVTRHHLDLSLLGYPADSSPSSFNQLLTEKKFQDDKIHLLSSDGASSGDFRLEYHMSALNRNVSSSVVLLNGQPLLMTPSGELPTLALVEVNSTSPISVEPLTYAYVVIQNANVPACAASDSETFRSQSTA
ncbi:hypothetical protein R1sor_022563 [Riccia sorocarpa]|uniref:Heparanase n=1 Tax=Riccia sorocarpa TaxID=122646 RepID=A0ABD3GK72_9MARC